MDADAQNKRAAPASNGAAPEPKKRIVLGAPTPLPVASTAQANAQQASERDVRDAAMDDAERTAPGEGAEDEDDGSDSAESVADDDAAHQESLKRLSDEEKQELVERVMEAMGEADHYADMMEGGPPDRPLGQPHPTVAAERLEVERETLEELRAEMRNDCIDFSEEELAEELLERWACLDSDRHVARGRAAELAAPRSRGPRGHPAPHSLRSPPFAAQRSGARTTRPS